MMHIVKIQRRAMLFLAICVFHAGAMYAQDKKADAKKTIQVPVSDVKEPIAAKDSKDETPEDVYYTQQRIINLPTGLNLKKKDLEVNFMHRFKADLNVPSQRKASDFFGLDNGSVLSLDLSYGVTDWLTMGVQRTSVNKNLEMYGQVAILREYAQSDFDLVRKFPLSISFRSGAAVGLREGIDDNWSGNFQLILSRELFNGYLHLYVSPSATTVAHYSVDRKDHVVGVVGTGAYIAPFGRTSGFRLSGEYIIPFRGYAEYKNTWGAGLNIVTGEHTFSIIVSSTTGTTLDLYAQSGVTNEMHLGFNMTRRFFPFSSTVGDKK